MHECVYDGTDRKHMINWNYLVIYIKGGKYRWRQIKPGNLPSLLVPPSLHSGNVLHVLKRNKNCVKKSCSVVKKTKSHTLQGF